MSQQVLNINADAVVELTNKLEKLHKSDLPVVINQTLNKIAFDVKENTMLDISRKKFINRRPVFFRKFSRVVKSKGFDIKKMKATVGFIGAEKQQAVDDLNQQEHGGKIRGRSFIPVDSARVSKNKSKNVRPINRISELKKVGIFDAKRVQARTKKQKFIRAIFQARKINKDNAFVISPNVGRGGSRILYRIKVAKSRGGRVSLKRTALYSVKSNRSVKVKKTQFMRDASLKSGLKLEEFFIKNAKRRINLKKIRASK